MWDADKNTIFSDFVTRNKNQFSAEEATITDLVTTIFFIFESVNGIIRQWKFPDRVLPHIKIPYKEELKQWKFPDRVLTNKQIPYKEGLKQWKFLDRVLPKKIIIIK